MLQHLNSMLFQGLNRGGQESLLASVEDRHNQIRGRSADPGSTIFGYLRKLSKTRGGSGSR